MQQIAGEGADVLQLPVGERDPATRGERALLQRDDDRLRLHRGGRETGRRRVREINGGLQFVPLVHQRFVSRGRRRRGLRGRRLCGRGLREEGTRGDQAQRGKQASEMTHGADFPAVSGGLTDI
jgi:hypothetical protein